MRLLVELSGEHAELPAAEVLAAVEAEGETPAVAAAKPGLLILETDIDPQVLGSRVALARSVNRVLAEGSLKEILRAARDVDLQEETFSVRAVTPTFSQGSGRDPDLEADLGAVLATTGRVDLARPQHRFRLIQGDPSYLTEVVHRVEREAYEARRPEERLHPLPVSLHPRLARALVNLTRVPRGGRFHDPFCGTGGVVLEAALLGAVASGSDLDEAMVRRCKGEMAHQKAPAEVFEADVSGFPSQAGPLDAIATDPPYGRSATTAGESIGSLYERAFVACAEALKPGGRLAMVFPEKDYASLAGEGWTFEEAYALRVHKSLTRHFCVFRAY